jgi:DNA helicase-2/ATP-dependent DNA helicase PcrA
VAGVPVPGPASLGRQVVVVSAGAEPPAPWRDAPLVTIDDAVLADPGPTVRRLHEAWARREPIVIALGIDPAGSASRRRSRSSRGGVAPEAEPWFDRLHFLTWANTYDARAGEPTWWWAVKAARLDDAAAATPDGDADITLPDGTLAWIDGGPRMPAPAGLTLVHSDSVDLGALAVVPHEVVPQADLAADQLAAVGHVGGPARVIAPAGSGKTASSPNASATSTATAATSRPRCSPSPTTSRPNSRWRPAPPTSGPASARSTRSACGCWPSIEVGPRRWSTSRRCAG